MGSFSKTYDDPIKDGHIARAYSNCLALLRRACQQATLDRVDSAGRAKVYIWRKVDPARREPGHHKKRVNG